MFRIKNNSIVSTSFSVFFLVFLIPSEAYAYIDPGSASMFIQVIIGALVGVGITMKIYWKRLKFKLEEKFKR